MKVYCKNCVRLYCTGADQCDLPFQGNEINKDYWNAVVGPNYRELIDHRIDWVKQRQDKVGSGDFRYGKPSKLNKDHDCIFFKPKVWFRIKSLFKKGN